MNVRFQYKADVLLIFTLQFNPFPPELRLTDQRVFVRDLLTKYAGERQWEIT